jgi:hypothetical protein
MARVPSPPVARRLLKPSPENGMDNDDFEILRVAQARRVLTGGDIKSEVAFQNDVNRLLASLEDLWDRWAGESQPANR